jgi:WhiB family redox-sensing transcriptional regulator
MVTGMTSVDECPTRPVAEPWQSRAACADSDPDLFTTDELTLGVQLICARCPVQGECLDYALDHDERFGVWGGVTPGERRRLRRAVSSRGALG